MDDYSIIQDEVQTVSDDIVVLVKDNGKRLCGNLKRNFGNSVLSFENLEDELNFERRRFIMPDTHFSPKDKVSNRTWDNKLPIGRDIGIITVRNQDYFGCVVQLDYNYKKIWRDFYDNKKIAKFYFRTDFFIG